MTKSTAGGASPKDTTYEYDGMDRRDTETSDNKTKDFAYVGTTDQLTQQRTRTSGASQDFDYDATQELVGRAEGQNGTESQGSYQDYGTDANGSIEGLEGADGVIKPGNQYQYDPYGKIENENKLTDQPTKDNPFRFESFYYDSGVKQYDMRARNYRPEIGRFTSQDRFESASKDFNLQSDPLTQNRYAFAGGNPVNRVEFDGHLFGGLEDAAEDVGDAAKDFGEGAKESVEDTVEAVKHPKETAEGVAELGKSFVKDPVGTTKKAGQAIGECFEENAAKCSGKAVASLAGGKGVGAVGKAASAAGKASKAGKGAGAAGKAGGKSRSPGNRTPSPCSSFLPGTPVLMADGTTKPIEQVQAGDLVLATIPGTGQTAPFPVVAPITSLGEKHLIRITAGGVTTTATLQHPYWLVDEQRWIPAGSLSVGDRLQRADDSTAVVQAVSQYTVLRARVHNLTVATAHTYYAGAEPVLVHNAGCGRTPGGEPGSRPNMPFTPRGKQIVKDESRAQNHGEMRCVDCNRKVQDAERSRKGRPTPDNDAQVDHDKPKAHGGSGDPSNGKIRCAPCNRAKSDGAAPNRVQRGIRRVRRVLSDLF